MVFFRTFRRSRSSELKAVVSDFVFCFVMFFLNFNGFMYQEDVNFDPAADQNKRKQKETTKGDTLIALGPTVMKQIKVSFFICTKGYSLPSSAENSHPDCLPPICFVWLDA